MRQQVTIDEIKSGLVRQLHNVISRYVKPSADSYEKHGKLFTLNPGRADNSVGSFYIQLSGPDAGRWADFAVAPRPGSRAAYLCGDVLDLLGLCLGMSDAKDIITEAREFLGLETESPEQARKRKDADDKAALERKQDTARRAQKVEKQRKRAAGLWLSGQANLIGTPVDLYLKERGIDLWALPHVPGAIRYHPECRYYFEGEETDQSTGEVRKRMMWRPYPAMVTAIARGPEIIDCHRTYLALDDAGLWRKAPLPDAKKVFADYTGGSIRLCGEAGPRGGQLKLKQAPPGARVFMTEGIENALSLIMLRQLAGKPPAFVVAAGALYNMAEIELPATVGEVVLCADNDSGAQAQALLQKAVDFHAGLGRAVRVWRSMTPGEDLNDALKRAMTEKEGAA